MNKKFLKLSILFVFTVSIMFAQKSKINQYKYIIVPNQYEFQKSVDAYQINSLVKFLFNREGFNAISSTDKFPQDLAFNRCLALTAIVNNNSGFLNTKMNIDLVDCFNNVVYSTQEGVTKEKDYKKAYHETIREAFVDFETFDYSYTGPKLDNKLEDSDDVVSVPKKDEKHLVPVVKQQMVEKAEDRKEQASDKMNSHIPNRKTDLIEGKYLIDQWGICSISKIEDYYSVTSGDEKFEIATIYTTSKPTSFIIKWNALKQPQSLEIDENASLKVDDNQTIKIYKKVN